LKKRGAILGGMKEVFYRFTSVCDRLCAHCAYDSGPSAQPTPPFTIERVLDHLPRDLSRLVVSGGEPFAAPEQLFEILAYARDELPRAMLRLQTNCAWATDEERAYHVLSRLSALGVKEVQWTGRDRYHAATGLPVELLESPEGPLRRAEKRLKNNGVPLIVSRSGTYKDQVLPFGRAVALFQRLHAPASVCVAGADSDGYRNITINPSGLVYPCCWEGTPAIGSAVTTPLDAIVAQALQDPVFHGLFSDGVPGAAAAAGIELDPEAYQNPCAACEQLFSDIWEWKFQRRTVPDKGSESF
jgi:organic radical activating enzyme